MRSFSVLSVLLVATSASAFPVITIPVTKLQRTGAYLKGSPDADRARAAFLKSCTGSVPTTVPTTNLAFVQYTARFKGELTYVPVTKTHPASTYWGINITSSTYGNHPIIPNSTAGIVDTGTTWVLLADDFFASYMDAIPGAKLDSNTGLIDIPHSSIPHMQPLNFVVADRVFTMDVTAQLIPTDQNTAWGGIAGRRYGVVGDTGNPSGEGLNFIIGQKFIERYYVVLDGDANRVGFAETDNTFT